MRIHLLGTAALVQELRAHEIDGEEQAAYVLSTALFFTFTYYSGLVAAGQPLWSFASFLEGAAISVIHIYGIFKCLEAAGGRENKSFVLQLSCLYVPVAITTDLTAWISFWLIRAVFGSSVLALSESHSQLAIGLASAGADAFGLLAFVATTGSLAIIYVRLAKLLAEVQVGHSTADPTFQWTAAPPLN